MNSPAPVRAVQADDDLVGLSHAGSILDGYAKRQWSLYQQAIKRGDRLGATSAWDALVDTAERLMRLGERMSETPATTFDGLGVKTSRVVASLEARVASEIQSESERAGNARVLLSLLKDIETMAGRPLTGVPRRAANNG